MAKTIIAGLDIGTTAIRLVVCEVGDGKIPRVLTQVQRESQGLRRGYIVNAEVVTETILTAIKEAERAVKTPIKSVFLGIGGVTLTSKTSDGAVAVSRADLEINDLEIKRATEQSERNLGDFTNRHILHRFPLVYKLDGKKVLGRPEGLHGTKLEIKTLFVNCLSQHIQDFIRATEAAGLIVEDAIASPLAAAIVALTPTQKQAGCVLINLGGQTTSIVVFEEGIPISIASFPVGSNEVTNDIALGLQIAPEEAEKIKQEHSAGISLQRKLDEIVEARLTEIFELVENQLRKTGRSGLLPGGAIIIGGGARAAGLEKLAKNALKLPIKIFDPQKEGHLKNQMRDSGWTVAYGLCAYGLDHEIDESLGSKAKHFTRRILRWFNEFWP